MNIIRRIPHIQIWFLDDDLSLSAQYMTNKILERTIVGCYHALVNSVFYFSGIRSKKIYDYYVRTNSICDVFNNWCFKKFPKFTKFSTYESKWCRKCREHFDTVLTYFNILLDEYMYRFGKPHKLNNFSDWIVCDFNCDIIKRANLKTILFPWKNIDIRYRRKNIIDSYRLQFINSFSSDMFTEYLNCKRDIPQFVLDFNKNVL